MPISYGNNTRIYTLGPEGTDSERAGIHYLESNRINGSIILSPTFEEAISAFKQEAKSIIDANGKVISDLEEEAKSISAVNGESIKLTVPGVKLIIPGAYGPISNIFFDKFLKAEDAFILETMPMGLFQNPESSNKGLIGIHPATRSLIERTGKEFFEIVDYSSKQQALVECSRGNVEYCIGSVEEGKKHLNLIPGQNFGGISMTWNVFGFKL